jgi:diaminohydroxyphosphoribosylaminopyrimidine deaminase/5-amino-6-(5-phosphoribosylamino)uracil reductase
MSAAPPERAPPESAPSERALSERDRLDRARMGLALALARRRLGETWPNPAVGAVVAKEGRILGAAATAPGGRPHAEPQALAEAGAAARGASLYVTLEPCAHTGVTPPCVEAVIAAGIARVVIGARDPDPRVDGSGIARLRAAGIEVTEGVEGEAARALIAGFARRLAEGRPEVTLKLAATLDGRIATREGESKWITAEPARRAAHALRGEMDAVMVGVGTVMADDPRLTCRLPGYRHRPLGRVVVDSHLRTGLTTSLAVTMKEAPTWFLIDEKTDPARRAAFEALGAHLIALPRSPAGVDLRAGLKALGALGLTRLLVEGGARLAAALLRDDLVDRLVWFTAPALMGGDGWPAIAPLGIGQLAAMPRFTPVAVRRVGDDMMMEFVRRG